MHSRIVNRPDSATIIGDLLEHLELVAADLARYEHQLADSPLRHEAILADARKLAYKAEELRHAAISTTNFTTIDAP